VTCAHCVKDRDGQLHPEGAIAFQPCAMGLVVTAANASDPALLQGYAVRRNNAAKRTSQQAMGWLIGEIRDFPQQNDFDASLPESSPCGTLRGAVLGPLDNSNTNVDVALVLMETEVEHFCLPSFEFPTVSSPPLLLDRCGTQILKVDSFPTHTFDIYGKGARSDGMMKAQVDPSQSEIYFRSVQPEENGLTFMCVHAKAKANWNPGDSGTWCWTQDGHIVGMGMASAYIDGKTYCCVLPMADVLSAIEQILTDVPTTAQQELSG
jgi:hypothetical protein